MLTTTRGTATSLPKPMHGTAHLTAPLVNLAQHSSDQIEDTRPHSSNHDINGAGPARPATIPVCSTTSIDHELFPLEPRVEPSSGQSDTMGYVQRPDESGNLRLYPVSYAEYPGALPFDHLLTRGMVEQIVLPQNPGQYLKALYDSVKRFVRTFPGPDKQSITETKQQPNEIKDGTFDDFRVIRGRSTHNLANVLWPNLIPRVERWLMLNDPCDEFTRFVLAYLKVVSVWRNCVKAPMWCKDAVAAWCNEHQGLSEALKLAAAQEAFSTDRSLLITLPDIYMRTCPYFLMYAVHHPGPEMLSTPGTSTGRCVSEASGRSQLLHELTTAAYLWQMVLHIRGVASKPEWPSQPLLTQKIMQRKQKEWRSLKPSRLRKRTMIRYQGREMPRILNEVFGEPLKLGRFHPDILSRTQALESSSVTTLAFDTSYCYNAIGSFGNDAATPLSKGVTSRESSIGNLLPVKDDLLESFWRLRTLFHANTCKTLRYQLDKLIVETESKMKRELLPKDPFLSFACDYLRAMRTWDILSNAKRVISVSSEAVRGVFRHLSDTYKITDAVKRVAEMEPNSSGPRMLPEIYKTHPASSLLPYVTWFDTSKPEGIREILSMAGITQLDPMYKDGQQGSYKAIMSRLLTIIAEIWSLREIDDSGDQAS
eukprot:Blabericola_migrator_1__4774@NODE_2510_length_2659_cov_16_437886_g1571_i0_p1_GENE_NODE_2510_length_2659_cov_16_437886_g1571_i0NODE_2510_length_2659_cov_16_437886_g1571_i0_p1_ORF_typecomplete_len664_score59_03_NODE_2510_length_2659_cov_16_437886_g1571_i06662621